MGIFGSSESGEKSKLLWQALQSRRQLLTMGTAAGLGSFLTPAVSVAASQKEQLGCCEANVRSFGAIGDGQSDDTAAFQRALDWVHRTGGGIVYAPPGRYLFRGPLVIPDWRITARLVLLCAFAHWDQG